MKVADMKVELVDHMGSDLSVVDAARVSMAKKSCWKEYEEGELHERDIKLINYLAKHQHWTPFSHPQLSFRIKAPIFVARQWFKHMIGITRNETSRRYVDEEPEFYLPDVWRGRPEGSIKQGSSGVVDLKGFTDAKRNYDDQIYDWFPPDLCDLALGMYNHMLQQGVAPEQSRMILPQNMMTEWIETASLAAVCRACKLRLDPHAQQETRDIAEQMAEVVAPLFPVSWSALMED